MLTQRLRISGKEVRRRLSEAEDLGPRTTLNGQPLDPKLAPPTATAQQSGAIGPEHVAEIRSFLGKLPTWVDPRGSGALGEDVGAHRILHGGA